jgi:hypothetical protein
MATPWSRQGPELTAISLIDECIEYSEKRYQQLPAPVQQRVSAIISAFRSKSIRAESPQEFGDLIASLAELVPIQNPLFSELSESIAALCIDREFVQFQDEALTTVFGIILNHLELRTMDPSPGIRALSTLLYANTLRLMEFHERILEIALAVGNVSEESRRRCCVLLGNLTAFSKAHLDQTTYSRSIRFLLQALNASQSTDLLASALRALQLLFLDAKSEVLDPQVLCNAISSIAFRQNPGLLKFEAVMALKALVNTSKMAFYAQWSPVLARDPSVFDLLRLNPRVAKASADLLTDIFRDTWKYLQIADNTSGRSAFTTLAQQVGDIVDISFNRFLTVLSRTGKDKLDAAVFNRTSKAFATFVRNCSFDSGKLHGEYIERIVAWCRANLQSVPEEGLIVLKSLLWTDMKCQPFAAVFGYLFETFVDFIGHQNPEFSKPASFALCRMAYAYPNELIARYEGLGAKLKDIGPIHSLPILLRLAENGLEDMTIWLDILEFHVPTAFEIQHQRSIERSMQCIGLVGPVYDRLPDNLQRFCLSTALSGDGPEAARAVGLLARSSAADSSSVFLPDALMKLISMNPPYLQSLSNALEMYALKYRDVFEREWIGRIMGCLQNDTSPYRPRCMGFMFAFLTGDSPEWRTCLDGLVQFLHDREPKVRWNAAAALAVAFKFGASNEDLIGMLIDALEEDRIAKVKIKSADALLSVSSRADLGEHFHRLFDLVLQLLLIPAHFTHLAPGVQRKYDSAFRKSLTSLFFVLLRWTIPRDFAQIEEPLISNVDAIYDLMSAEDDAPWEPITRLYEAKFNSRIPSKTLEKFQERAFPV